MTKGAALVSLLDIAIIVIILLSTLVCALKGFVKTIFGVVGTIVAFIIAVVVGFAAHGAVYNAYFKEGTTQFAQNFVEQVDTGAMVEDVLRENGVEGDFDSEELNEAIAKDGEMGDNVSEYLDEKGVKTDKDVNKIIDDFAKSPNVSDETLEKYHIDREQFNEIIKDSTEHLKEALKAAADKDKTKAARYIEEHILSPIVKRLVRDGLIILIFVFLKIIICIVIMATGVMKRFELVKKTDTLLGAALGFFSGVVTVVVYAYFISLAVKMTGGGIAPFDEATIENTVILEFFYRFFSK